MIKVEDLEFGFKGSFTLSVHSLEIKDGEIFSLMGPNGAGKTTLLNIVGSFEKSYDGTVEVFGQNILDNKFSRFCRKEMTHIFPQPYLLNMSVHDNVALPLRFRGIKDSTRIDEVLDFFKVSSFRDKNALQLSQGEKHRVTLARAFVANPKLILLDEPFLSLDPRYKETLIQDLRARIKIDKATALFVSQDHNEILGLTDRIAVMDRGRILQTGTPQEVFTQPSSVEVADFVGVETLAEGVITGKQDNLCSILVGDKLLKSVSPFQKGDSVLVCLRPEDVILSRKDETTSARNHLKAGVLQVAPWKLEYRITLDCGFKLIASVTRQSVDSLGLKAGETVFASFKATAVHLIRRNTGQREEINRR